MNDINQLAGCLYALQDHGEQLDYDFLHNEIRMFFHDSKDKDTSYPHQFQPETIQKIRDMLRKYRTMCLQLKLIGIGQLWTDRECEPRSYNRQCFTK
jgi:hypothetical protein